jgi:hypothetical protein
MDNISAICTHRWRRARSDALAPHREEAAAVRDMSDLYAWGEVLTRSYQGDDLEDSDWESVMGDFSSTDGNEIWVMVGEAAKKLCEWLGDDKALEVCGELANELRFSKEKEDGGESSDGLGGIL